MDCLNIKSDTHIFSGKIGFFIVGIFGCINHFVYKISGFNPIIGIFAPINESTWEHLKLLFFPYILYTFAEYFIYGKNINGFIFSRTKGLLAGLVFIPAGFYTYTAILGTNYFIVDILLFFISVYLSFRISTAAINKKIKTGISRTISALLLITGITILFIGFTFYPPAAPLFENPIITTSLYNNTNFS